MLIYQNLTLIIIRKSEILLWAIYLQKNQKQKHLLINPRNQNIFLLKIITIGALLTFLVLLGYILPRCEGISHIPGMYIHI